MKRLTVTGSTMRASPNERKARSRDSLRTNVWPLLENGAVKPVVHRVFPFAEAAAAHAPDGILAARRQDHADRTRLGTPKTGARQYVARPPEASNTAPVENEHSSLASQQISAAISCTAPKRPIGIFDSMKSMCCCDIWSKMAVRTAAGVTQFTRIPVFASSLPSDFVSPITPAFDVLYADALGVALLARDGGDVHDAP